MYTQEGLVTKVVITQVNVLFDIANSKWHFVNVFNLFFINDLHKVNNEVNKIFSVVMISNGVCKTYFT